MKQAHLKKSLQTACLAVVLVTSASHADIYKWVDSNGKVHYSENKDDAGKAKVEQVKVPTQPSTNSPAALSWKDQEIEFRKRQAKKIPEQANQPEPPAPKLVSGNESEADASRCELAKNILAGKMIHGNGAKADSNDKSIAERDVSTYCH